MISISEIDVLRTAHDEFIYIGSICPSSSITCHFYTNPAHDQLYHRDLISSTLYLPLSSMSISAQVESKHRKYALLNTLNSLSMSPANISPVESKFDLEMDPLLSPQEDDSFASTSLSHYLTHPKGGNVFVFKISYQSSDPQSTLSYSVEVVELQAFLPRQVTPLVSITFSCNYDEHMLVIGCTKGYICQYNLKLRNLQIVRHGLHSIENLSCKVVPKGTLLLFCSQDQVSVVLIPSEGFDDRESHPKTSALSNDLSVEMPSLASEANVLEESVWTECSSDSEAFDVSFLPPDSVFDSFQSTDIISPSSIQTDNFLEDCLPPKSFFFEESDIIPFSHSKGFAFIPQEDSGTLHVYHRDETSFSLLISHRFAVQRGFMQAL